jgi:hypothetical protein
MQQVIRSVLLVLLAALPAAAQTPRPVQPGTDSVLFAEVISHLGRDAAIAVRVDPRPLRPDAELVTLTDLGHVLPQRISPRAQADPLAVVHADVMATREATLRRASIQQTNALADARCPGIMMVPSKDLDSLKRDACPSTPFLSVVLALPRAGGPWWPGHLDQRTQFADRHAVSIRVIARHMTLRGSTESAADYVFEIGAQGRWSLVEVVSLLVVE